jgi:serine/threonine protein kinase
VPSRERKPLGAGSFGGVVQAEELDNAGNVVRKGLALKRLRPMSRCIPEDVARFRREVTLMRELIHPNIIEVVDADLDREDVKDRRNSPDVITRIPHL